MSVLLFIIAGIMLLSALLTITSIGQKRTPLTAGQAAAIVLINANFIVVLVIAALYGVTPW